VLNNEILLKRNLEGLRDCDCGWRSGFELDWYQVGSPNQVTGSPKTILAGITDPDIRESFQRPFTRPEGI
jgi:hypothetical protein